MDPVFSHLPDEKPVGDLCQDSHAVPGLAFRILSCPVSQIFHDGQGITDQFMAGPAFDIDDRTDPTVIMFKGRTIKSFPLNTFK